MINDEEMMQDNVQPLPESEVCPPENEELIQMKDQWLRTVAELENTRKRALKEKEESSKYAVAQMAREFLSVLDNLSRALESTGTLGVEIPDALKGFIEGVEMTQKEILAVFSKFHVSAIVPTGEVFQPEWHQAMVEVPTADLPAGHVVSVLQVGYKIHDRLLRPALVTVSKALYSKGLSSKCVRR